MEAFRFILKNLTRVLSHTFPSEVSHELIEILAEDTQCHVQCYDTVSDLLYDSKYKRVLHQAPRRSHLRKRPVLSTVRKDRIDLNTAKMLMRLLYQDLLLAGPRNVAEARVATVFYFLQHGQDKSTAKFLMRTFLGSGGRFIEREGVSTLSIHGYPWDLRYLLKVFSKLFVCFSIVGFKKFL